MNLTLCHLYSVGGIFMSEALLTALIGAGATLMVQILTVYISVLKENLRVKQTEFQAKRNNLI